jgi:glycosyltransferase involved in cell wall biosynthesis
MASVDILVPNYNYGRYLRACVGSVLSQDLEDLRVLIVDNASTDDSHTIARDLARSDPRVKLVLRAENLGPHASFNEGIDWAGSDYFLLLFADDFLMPGALRRAVAIMERDRSIAFTYGHDVAISGDAAIPDIGEQPEDVPYSVADGHDFIERFCRLGVFQIPGPSIIIRTSAQKQAGHYDAALPHSDDYHMWLRLALQGRVAALDCIQAGIRSHGANRSEDLRARHILHIQHTADAAEHFFTREGAVLPDCEYLRRLARRGIAERAYWSAISHALRGERGTVELLRLAVGLRPMLAILPPVGYLLRRPDTIRRLGRLTRSFTRPDQPRLA